MAKSNNPIPPLGKKHNRIRNHNRLSYDTGFLRIAPWLNLFIIAIILFIVSNRITIIPGVKISLPTSPLSEGISSHAPSAVLLTPSSNADPILFFNDIRYNLKDEKERERLKLTLRVSQERNGWNEIILYADEQVPHGAIVSFINIAREVTLASVYVAVKSEN